MDTERQKENGMSDYNRFFENSWERFIEIISDVKEVAASEDIKTVRERVEDLKKMSDGFQKIDVNKLSDNEKKFCKHFTKAPDRISGLYNSGHFRERRSFQQGRLKACLCSCQRSLSCVPRFDHCKEIY